MADEDHLPAVHLYLKPEAFAINLQQASRPGDIDLHPSAWRYGGSEIWQGEEYERDITISPSENTGIRAHSFGDDNLFWRIWFEPSKIDAKFIVEDHDYQIKVWNAFVDVTAALTAIVSESPDGTSIDSFTLPKTIVKFGELSIGLTVYRDGPPLQHTTYTFTINGADYSTLITGLRAIAWPYEPDYSQRPRMTLVFETAVTRNIRFVEQRRPLRDRCLVNTDIRTWAEGVDAQRLKNLMKAGHDKIFGVAIHTEHCYPSQPVTGQTVIQCSNALDKHWFLNNQADYAILIDHAALVAELKAISSVGASSITLAMPVVKTFTWQSTVVYPVAFSTLKEFKIAGKSDQVLGIDVSFQEFVFNV